MSYLSESFKLNQTLELIDVSHNFVFSQGIISLSSSLESNSSIKEIDISLNSFGDEEIKSFSESLLINSNLEVINFGFVKINEKKVEYLTNCLKENKTLKKIIFDESSDQQNLEKNIKFFLEANKEWNLSIHRSLDSTFKQAVFQLLLVFKELNKTKKIKVPKYVVQEIIKRVDRKSFYPLFQKKLN